MFKIKNFFLIIILLALLASFNLPLALASSPKLQDASQNIQTTASEAGVSSADIPGIAVAVVNALLALVGMVFFIYFIYGGFKWMTAAGSPEKVEKAKKLLINAVIGLALIALAYSIAYFIIQAIETPSTTVTPTNTTNTP